jgi:hypothetical protein
VSDFDDDEPIEGPRSSSDRPAKGRGGRDDAGRSGGRPPVDDEDWDDEPVASRGAAGGRGGAGDDDWDDDDWDDDDDGGGRGGRRDLTLIIAIAAGVAIIALVVILTRPKSDNTATTDGGSPPAGATTAVKGDLCPGWPGAFGGDGSNVAKGDGVYVWSGIVKAKDDGHGSTNAIHIRANRTEAVVVKVTASSAITVKAKGNATASAATGKDLTLTIPAGPGVDGPDLNVPCEATSLSFDVSSGGTAIPAGEIKVGGSAKATANPATFNRGDP